MRARWSTHLLVRAAAITGSRGGNCSTSSPWITDGRFQQEVNQGIAAGDTGTGVSVPADIPTADATAGETMWSSLGNAANSLKTAAGAWMEGMGGWPMFAAYGSLAFGTGFAGWEIGSLLRQPILSFFGISQGTGTISPTAPGTVSATGVTACS